MHNKLTFNPKKKFSETKNKFNPQEAGFLNNYPEFSFKFYDHIHKIYSIKCINNIHDFHIMFERLKTMSELKWKDIKNSSHKFHFHPIEWGKTTEHNGFKNLPADLKDFPAWQFKIFKECRIIGFFNQNNVFELIWIDRDHKVYSYH